MSVIITLTSCIQYFILTKTQTMQGGTKVRAFRRASTQGSGPAFSLRSVLSTGALLRRPFLGPARSKFVRVRMRFIRVRIYLGLVRSA